MKDSRTKKAFKNVIYSTIIKIVTFAIGLVIPRFVIGGYGSEINGMLQTVSNIYSYLALIIAGVGTASIQGLYKPVSQNDKDAISSVMVATRNYYRKLLVWYGIAVAAFSAIYPFVVNTNINKLTIVAIIILEGVSFMLTYFFASALQSLLSADGKEYVTQFVTFGIFLITSAVKLILIYLNVDIVILQLSYLLINVLRILIYNVYIKKNYPWINWKAKPNFEVLKNRKHFMLNGIAWTVFSSTDTIIISTFCGFVSASIYGMYNLVFANLNMILAMLYSSTYFVLGQVYNEDREKYIKLHDGLESAVSSVMFALLSVAYVLILPFLRLYLSGVSDVNYIDAYLPMLFCLVQMLSNIRLFSGNLINISNNPKMTNKASIAETVINITLSLVLAKTIGMHGVLIATIIALTYKSNFIIIISNKKILSRSPMKTFMTVGVNFLMFFLIAIISNFVELKITSYFEFIAWGVGLCVAFVSLFFAVNVLCNRNVISTLKMMKEKS